MKSSHSRAVAALLLTLGLAACGGKEGFDVTGTISGLSNPGLVLQNNGDTVAPAKGATSFTFPKQVEYGTDYAITVKTPPDHMTCSVTSGTGNAGHFTSIVASVSCLQNSYTIGGSIVNLKGAGLVLINGSTGGSVAPAAAATTFTFPATVNDGTAYGVTVKTQPTGQLCVPSREAGVMGNAAVTNIVITCT
jgi:hypothetical protein